MFDDFFYDKKCTIYRTTYGKVDWDTQESKSATYTDISCALWKQKANAINNSPLSRNTDKSLYMINLDWEYTDIKRWDKVEIYHDINGTDQLVGTYTVADFIPYNDTDGVVDNTSLYVTKLDE